MVFGEKIMSQVELNLQSVSVENPKLWQEFLDLSMEYIKANWPDEISTSLIDFKKKYEADLLKRLTEGGRGLFLFKSDVKTVGLGNVYIESTPKGVVVNIAEFYIKPEFRKQKLGSQFFNLLQKWGFENKARFVYVEVDKDLELANAFWAKQNLKLDDTGKRNLFWNSLEVF
jgi:hypothetical protein